MGILRHEYWGGLSCPPPEDLPNPGIKPTSPALQADSSLSEPLEKPLCLLAFPFYIWVLLYRVNIS